MGEIIINNLKYNKRLLLVMLVVFWLMFISSLNISSAQTTESYSIGFFVSEKDSEKPIKNATIIVTRENFRQDFRTNEQGLVSIALFPNTYSIKIRHENFSTIEKDLIINRSTTYSFEMGEKKDSNQFCSSVPCAIIPLIIGAIVINLLIRCRNNDKNKKVRE